MKDLGVTTKVPELQKVALFDSTFDASDPEKYARSFLVNSLSN
jgi:hypothetical protein